MDELTLPGVAGLVLTTGVVTAIINQTLGGWLAGRRQRSEQAHQRALQAEQRAHERQLRLEQAHAQARDVFLEEVAGGSEWIGHEWGRVHGLDVDWVPDHDPAPAFSSVTETIQALRRVELRHPTRRVRELAATLRQAISGRYGSIEPVWNQSVRDYEHKTGTPPSDETFRKWLELSEKLVDAIHEPPAD